MRGQAKVTKANLTLEWAQMSRTTKRYEPVRLGVAVACVLFAVITCAGCGAAQDPVTHTQLIDRVATSPTNQYLRARETLIRSAMADLAAGRAPMTAFVARVRAECPDALRDTPLYYFKRRVKGASVAHERALVGEARFSGEIEDVLEAAQQVRQTAVVLRFAKTVDTIRWNNPVVTDLIRAFVEIELERRHIGQLIDVCHAIKEWANSGYRKPPVLIPIEPGGALGERWVRDVAALGCGKFSPADPGVVLTALRRYQQPGSHPTTREVEIMEFRLFVEESRARKGAARSLRQALGLSTTRRQRPRHGRPINALRLPSEPPGCSGKPDLIFEPVKKDAAVGSRVAKATRPKSAANKPLTDKPRARKPQTKRSQATKSQAQKTDSFRDRLVAKVAACLHKAGVEIPRSDFALLSSTSGIRTRSPRVKAAIGRCRSESLAAASR
jgi:hypothetical protein